MRDPSNTPKPPRSGGARAANEDGRCRVFIERVTPELDGGRHPIKRVVGERLVVEADLVADGHDVLRGFLLHRHEREETFHEVALAPGPNDRWSASFELLELGVHLYAVEAFVDRFATWQRSLARKVEAGQDVSSDLLEGAALVAACASRATPADAAALTGFAARLRGDDPREARVALAASKSLAEAAARAPDRSAASRSQVTPRVIVDPPRARFGAWYEMFPRSAGPAGRHGTLRDVEARLAYVAEMGFDVLYLPPIHPIGESHRKGPNNAEEAGPTDPGSPWAVGSKLGGHKSIHPELGTLDDFDRLVEKARALGIDVALDIAFQASPDHPYVREHPEWFRHRPDGSIQYAENPPKKYQDIYPFDFECEAWEALWDELRSVVLFWIARGVRVFRVDNPHTKPLPFWEWLITTVKAAHPDVVFLAEAFTRPKLMYALAKVGFSQSYTYFTWRETARELSAYMEELTQTEVAEFFRPSFWPTTPDILPEHIQHGGRPTFLSRLVLAATLASSYGVYGPLYELMEHVARPGADEYLGSEKYEIRSWDIDRPGSLRHVIARLNRARREHPALQDTKNLRFLPSSNDVLLAYSKRTDDRSDVVLVVVNLDPHHKHSAWIEVDAEEIGVAPGERFQVHDLVSDARYSFSGGKNFVEIDPQSMPAHLFAVRRLARNEKSFEYYL